MTDLSILENNLLRWAIDNHKIVNRVSDDIPALTFTPPIFNVVTRVELVQRRAHGRNSMIESTQLSKYLKGAADTLKKSREHQRMKAVMLACMKGSSICINLMKCVNSFMRPRYENDLLYLPLCNKSIDPWGLTQTVT